MSTLPLIVSTVHFAIHIVFYEVTLKPIGDIIMFSNAPITIYTAQSSHDDAAKLNFADSNCGFDKDEHRHLVHKTS